MESNAKLKIPFNYLGQGTNAPRHYQCYLGEDHWAKATVTYFRATFSKSVNLLGLPQALTSNRFLNTVPLACIQGC